MAVAEAHERRGRPNFLISWPCALERALRDDSGAYLTLEIGHSPTPVRPRAVQVRGVLGGRQHGRSADLGVLWRRGLFCGAADPARARACSWPPGCPRGACCARCSPRGGCTPPTGRANASRCGASSVHPVRVCTRPSSSSCACAWHVTACEHLPLCLCWLRHSCERLVEDVLLIPLYKCHVVR